MVLPDSNRISRVPLYSGVFFSSICGIQLQGYHLLWPGFHTVRLSTYRAAVNCNPQTEDPTTLVKQRLQAWHLTSLGSSPFARRYLGSLVLIYFPLGTKMFQFPRFASHSLCIQLWIIGFPHSEIFGSMLSWQLPEAYRRLLRPSSPVDARASTARPFSLHHYIVSICAFCEISKSAASSLGLKASTTFLQRTSSPDGEPTRCLDALPLFRLGYSYSLFKDALMKRSKQEPERDAASFIEGRDLVKGADAT